MHPAGCKPSQLDPGEYEQALRPGPLMAQRAVPSQCRHGTGELGSFQEPVGGQGLGNGKNIRQGLSVPGLFILLLTTNMTVASHFPSFLSFPFYLISYWY